MSTVAAIHQRGTRGAQPAATAVSIGTLYCVTDESNLVERSNGTTWQSYSASGAGSGTVTNTGTLTSGKTIIGNGSADVTVSSLTAQFVGSSSGTAAAASMTTARLLGRTTSSSGAVEEITVGAGLTLSAGALTDNGGLLEQHAASTSGSLDFTTFISSAYDEYLFEFHHIIPTNNAVYLTMRMNTGSGFDSGANYSYTDWRYVPAGTAQSGLTAQTSIFLSNPTDTMSNNAAWGYCGTMRLYLGDGAATYPRTVTEGFYLNSSGTREGLETRGAYEVTTALTQVQFLMSASTIASGTIRCYRITK